YTVQLSGSTIYVAPLDAVPLRNVPVIAPALPLDGETIDPSAVASATQVMLKRLDLNGGGAPVGGVVPRAGGRALPAARPHRCCGSTHSVAAWSRASAAS